MRVRGRRGLKREDEEGDAGLAALILGELGTPTVGRGLLVKRDGRDKRNGIGSLSKDATVESCWVLKEVRRVWSVECAMHTGRMMYVAAVPQHDMLLTRCGNGVERRRLSEQCGEGTSYDA